MGGNANGRGQSDPRRFLEERKDPRSGPGWGGGEGAIERVLV